MSRLTIRIELSRPTLEEAVAATSKGVLTTNAVSNPKVEWQLGLPLDSIRVDPAIQQRAAGTSQDIVDEYAEAMRNGAEFPPIDVFNNGDGGFDLANGFDLADGFHRLKAHRLAHPDANNIECKVHLGNRDDALLFACGANAQHGLQRSRSDKLKAVMTLIHSERYPAMRGLAYLCR
jgi:hypothetical protein